VGSLPKGTTVRDFPAIGRGLDVQWSRGRFNINGELQRFRFDAPNFVVAPNYTTAYAEVKGRVTPRLYGAVRTGFFKSGTVSDVHGVSISAYPPTIRSTEVGLGFWLMPRLLLKTSYEFQQLSGGTGSLNNVFGLQLVAQFKQLQWGWR
jgi:hypothetical protein